MSPKLTRRQFIAGSLAAGAALSASDLSAASVPKIKSLTDRVKLGRTGIEVSYLGFGTGTVGWNKQSNQTRLGTVEFARMIRHAFDQGVNYFDCADIYGSHPYLRASLKGIPRDRYVLESKVWFRTSKDAQAALDRFLQELNTDYIDVLLLHCIDDTNWQADLGQMMDVLEEAKQKKRIRAHGISLHSLDVMKQAAEDPWVDFALCRINPLGVKMDAPTDQVVPVLKRLHEAGKGVTGIKILGEGKIADQREQSLRYVLGLDCVDAVVIGFESKAQVDDILSLGRKALSGW
ncbi:MAG: aldo/keto reductase [Armatimonadetes bacterium]|nr:aldo/keto reductase [Armatimonadota bacterium]